METRYDMRRLPPRNSRGEFRRRRSRRDRGMDYGRYDMRMRDYGDYEGDMARGGRSSRGGRGRDYADYDDMRGRDYAENQMGDSDMRGNYRRADMDDMARRNDYGYDGHHGMRSGYEPVEFMGYCSGYYGAPDQDYARGGRRDYGYDMRRGGYRDYGYDYGDDYGDFGETLSEQELEKWNKKLLGQLDEREKQMFSKDAISQKAKAMGKIMEGFGEKELYTTVLMVYSDYKPTIGQNPDIAIKLAFDWLTDKDVAVKGAEKLAVYYDCIVEGEDD